MDQVLLLSNKDHFYWVITRAWVGERGGYGQGLGVVRSIFYFLRGRRQGVHSWGQCLLIYIQWKTW